MIIENNTFEKGSGAAYYNVINNNPDPVDRLIELSNEKTALYERMLELEKEKMLFGVGNKIFEELLTIDIENLNWRKISMHCLIEREPSMKQMQ